MTVFDLLFFPVIVVFVDSLERESFSLCLLMFVSQTRERKCGPKERILCSCRLSLWICIEMEVREWKHDWMKKRSTSKETPFLVLLFFFNISHSVLELQLSCLALSLHSFSDPFFHSLFSFSSFRELETSIVSYGEVFDPWMSMIIIRHDLTRNEKSEKKWNSWSRLKAKAITKIVRNREDDKKRMRRKSKEMGKLSDGAWLQPITCFKANETTDWTKK